MPVVATQHTAAGAKAFAEFFIRTFDWGYATTSSSYMRHYYTKSCVACDSGARAIDDAARRGRRFIGDRFTIRSVSTVGDVDSATVTVYFDVTAGEVVDRHGKYVTADMAHRNVDEVISPRWSGTGWQVIRMVPQ